MAVTRDDRVEKSLRRRYERALPAALTAAGMVVVTRVQRIFIIFRPRGWATGATVRSLTVSPPETNMSGMTRVKIGPTTAYAKYLHYGRPPGGMPPVENILAWVKEKKLAGSYASVGSSRGGYPRHGRRGGRKRQAREDLALAWAIAKKIEREGTEPFPFLITGFRQAKRDALRVFRRTLMAGVAASGRT